MWDSPEASKLNLTLFLCFLLDKVILEAAIFEKKKQKQTI